LTHRAKDIPNGEENVAQLHLASDLNALMRLFGERLLLLGDAAFRMSLNAINRNVMDSPTKRTRVALYTKEWRSAGTGLIAQELAFALAGLGVSTRLIAPVPEEVRFQAAHPHLEVWRTVRAADASPSRWRRASASLRRFLAGCAGLCAARLAGEVVIVTIPDPLALSGPVLALFKLTGGRIIYVVHDPLPHAWRTRGALRHLERAGYWLPTALADRLVVLTPAAKDALIAAHATPAGRIDVIEHGAFVRGEPQPLPGAGELLLFGALRRNKGIREAIEGVVAARALGINVRLRIAGAPHSDEPAYWAECAALAHAHPDAVKLEIGFVENARLDALIAACDGFLMPYRDFNSQSGVAMLAASNARPVIATAEGGIAALFSEGMAGAVIAQPGDGPAVAAAISKFFAMPLAQRSNDATAYRALTIARRGWPAIAAHYARLAAELTG
jgi:glycogen synthase